MALILEIRDGEVGGKLRTACVFETFKDETVTHDAGRVVLNEFGSKQGRFPGVLEHAAAQGATLEGRVEGVIRVGDVVRIATAEEIAVAVAAKEAAIAEKQREQLVHVTAASVGLVSAAERLRRGGEISAELAQSLRVGTGFESELVDRALVEDDTLLEVLEVADALDASTRAALRAILDILVGKARNPLRA